VFAANHVTFIDGLLISALSDKPVRYLVLSTFWKKPLSRFVLNAIGAIPFGTGGVSETRRGFEAAREHLQNGGYVCIFPEGVLTRTGHLHPFKRGIEKLLEGVEAQDVQIVPIHLYLSQMKSSDLGFGNCGTEWAEVISKSIAPLFRLLRECFVKESAN
jgi:1-acyl-sn-glycerol-3-phosphate acyltransferase